MFGLIIPSRPLLPFTSLSPTQYAITCPIAPAIIPATAPAPIAATAPALAPSSASASALAPATATSSARTPSFSHLVIFLLPGNALPASSAAAIYISFSGAAGSFRLLGALTPEKQSAIFRVRNGSNSNGNSHSNNANDGGGGGVGSDATPVADVPEVDMDADDTTGLETPSTTSPTTAGLGTELTLGIAIEAAEGVAAQLAALKASATTAARTAAGGLDTGDAIVEEDLQEIDTETETEAKAGSMALTHARGSTSTRPPSTKVLAQRIIGNAFNFLASFAAANEGGGEVVPLKSFQDWWTKFERRIDVDPGFLERSGEF